jgi:hypothetical protein
VLFTDAFSNTVVMYLSVRWKIITNDGLVRVWKRFAGVDVFTGTVQSVVR